MLTLRKNYLKLKFPNNPEIKVISISNKFNHSNSLFMGTTK